MKKDIRAWWRLALAGALALLALTLAGCAPQGEFPMPPGKSPFDYFLEVIRHYGIWGLLGAVLLLLLYTVFNSAFKQLSDWIAGRLTKRVIQTQEEREAEALRQRQMDAASAAYLAHVLSHHQTLNLRGIRSSRPLNLGLEDVYVSLTSVNRPSTREDGEARLPVRGRPLIVSLGELMSRHNRLVILGDPGAGKTTFLTYLALTYARALDGRWPKVMETRLGYHEELLPIFLPLRDFARHLRVRCQGGPVESGPALLLDFINQHFQQWNLSLPANFFSAPLEIGHCLVLLDGLDEVADYDERVLVREIVEAFVARYPQNRFVLTCRLAGYRDAARLASDFYECRIREFDGEDVRRFVNTWNVAIETAEAGTLTLAARHKAERQSVDLLNAIERNPRVRALATNPLMLTVIALVHRYRAALPQRRVELYDECTELLLGHWDMGKEGEAAKALAEYSGMDLPLAATEKRALLEPVARWYHESRLTQAEASQVEQILAGRLAGAERPAPDGEAKAPARARAFLSYLKERSGLFVEWEVGRFAFSHLTFQEYLAARDIASGDDYTVLLLTHLADSWWREVILLTAAHLSLTSRQRASQLVRAILVAGARQKTGWWQSVTLAGECLVDIGPYRIDAQLWQDVVNGLVWIAERRAAPLNDRLRAVSVLGELGDPRLGGTASVPAGDFAWDGNPAAKTPALAAFEIDRLPVTNAQFARFMQAGGYNTRKYWSDAGWEARQREGWEQPRFWDDPLWNRPNYPVVGVSWYEAEAYARWAGGALPAEAQWEKAAGWDAEAGRLRRWPWGDEPANERANTSELSLDSTTPVGLFPQGASPCGALDMAGNVWQWCADPYWEAGQNAAGAMVLRGGSWHDDLQLARVNSRDRAQPTTRETDIGFRLVWPKT